MADNNSNLRSSLEKIIQTIDKQYEKENPADTNLLTEALRRVKQVVEKPDRENIKSLNNLLTKMKGKGSNWAIVVGGILCVLGLLLVIAGVVGVPFSLGSSAILSGIGLKIMTVALGTCLASIGLTTGWFHGRACSNFNSSVLKSLEQFKANFPLEKNSPVPTADVSPVASI